MNTSNTNFRFLFAVFGQGLFSLSRFITTMVVGGRFNLNNVPTGAGSDADLGRYLAYFSMLLLGIAVLDAFVTIPMTYLMHSRKETQKPQFSTFLLLMSLVVSVLFFAVVLLAGGFAQMRYPDLSLITVGAFGFLLATQSLRQFFIRWLLAHLKTLHYAACELVYLMFYVVFIAVVIYCQQVFLTPIFLIIGIANLLVIGIIWWQHCESFAPIRSTLRLVGMLKSSGTVDDSESSNSKSAPELDSWSDFPTTLKEQIYFGRWLALDSFFALMTVYFFNWFLLLKIDAAASGIYGACMTIVLLANPLLNGVVSVFAPMAAIEYQKSGKAGVNRISWKYGTGLVVLMSLFAIFLWFSGGYLTKLFYGSSYDQFFAVNYSGVNRIPFLLGISMPLNAAAYIIACNLLACGQPKYNCYSSLAGLLVVVSLGVVMREPDLVWCAICFSIATGVILACRAWFYWTHRVESES